MQNDETPVTLALILRVDLESVPDIKRVVEQHGAVVVYQKLSVNKLFITDHAPFEGGPR